MHAQSNIEPDCSARVRQAPRPVSAKVRPPVVLRHQSTRHHHVQSAAPFGRVGASVTCYMARRTEAKLQPAKSWILIAHNTTAFHASTEPLPNKSPTLHIDARLPPRTLASHSSNSSTCSLSKRARYSATIKSAMPCPTASWSKQTYLQPSTPSATP